MGHETFQIKGPLKGVFYDLRVTFGNIYSCCEDFYYKDDNFMFSTNVWKSSANELLLKKNQNIIKY